MNLFLESKGLCEKFQKEYRPNFETEGGKKEFRTYLRLVLMTAVLEPKHCYHLASVKISIVFPNVERGTLSLFSEIRPEAC